MARIERWAGPAMLTFVVVVLIGNVPGVEARLTAVIGDAGASAFFNAAALIMFASLVLGTAAVAQHYRSNTSLKGGRRKAWYALLWMPAVGALAYYLRVMRRSRATAASPQEPGP